MKRRGNVSATGITIHFLYGGKIKKDVGLTLLVRLSQSSHSQARSHYCSPRGLLAAESPPWPGSALIRQPGRPRLLQTVHVDGVLSADTKSTWATRWQGSWPQAIHNTRPPSSWITGARQDSRSTVESTSNQFERYVNSIKSEAQIQQKFVFATFYRLCATINYTHVRLFHFCYCYKYIFIPSVFFWKIVEESYIFNVAHSMRRVFMYHVLSCDNSNMLAHSIINTACNRLL